MALTDKQIAEVYRLLALGTETQRAAFQVYLEGLRFNDRMHSYDATWEPWPPPWQDRGDCTGVPVPAEYYGVR